jgi:DNA (cytosine-5)-methyltransferase 1
MQYKNNFKYIELFAGCGGLSVGLNAAGFDLYFANELSPMAGETYSYNVLGENLMQFAEHHAASKKVLWLKSHYDRKNLRERLRENPFEYNKGTYVDINVHTDLEKKLLIGNINELLEFLDNPSNMDIKTRIRNYNIDLISGGPPCQGFSLAGKRVKEDSKNLLPLSFAKLVGMVEPKIVMLENVKGITAPFITDDGVKHYTWLEIAKAFALIDYIPICMLLNSKYFGVPQNRPRFILLAFRQDIVDKLLKRKTNSFNTTLILKNSISFFNKVQNGKDAIDKIKPSDIILYDIEARSSLFDGELLPLIKNEKGSFLSAKDAIGDITVTSKSYEIDSLRSKYPVNLSNIFHPKYDLYPSTLQNHDLRNHSFSVKARFRLFQALSNLNGMRHEASSILSGRNKDDDAVKRVFESLKLESVIIEPDNPEKLSRPKDLASFKNYLSKLESKKHSQRAIKRDEPAPAQMTIPDDLCHYSQKELRTLTVREMARIQSFPDWFVFRSKVTTGGKQRSYEVPQYTQVGNAVPPLLAYELGKTIYKLLNSIK